MNTALFPTNELAVRQAIVRGIDRQSILKGVLLGQEAPAEELLAKDIPFCDVALKPYPHSLDEAAAILDKAGWRLKSGDKYRTKDGKTLRLELKFIANENIMRSIAEVVQSNLARIGMDVQLKGEEPNAFGASQTDGGFNMIFCESNGAPYDPFSYVAAMRVAGHADFQAQRGLPQKKELDAAITRALATTDAKELQALFTTILTMLHDEAVYVPVSRTIDKALFKKKNIQDFSFSPVSYELPLGRVARP